jgi:hypothetical protein
VPEEYYERLGVDREASESEIKAAFRERIKETHPDVSDDEAASNRTKRLIEAKDVLTDPEKRERYDRLGHEGYVSGGDASVSTDTPSNAGESTSEGNRASAHSKQTGATATGSMGSNGQQTAGRTRTDTGREQSPTEQEGSGQTGGPNGRATDWYDSSRRQRSTAPTDDTHRVWDADQSYAVGDSPGMFSPRELLTSQRTIALLGTTFVIYPVLLFGALFQPFPTAVNLTVAMCIVLVIAFMQSVPQVGIFVFGIWTILLPIIVFGFLGISVLSVQGVLSLAAVSFPLGLSVLTWIALGPAAR